MASAFVSVIGYGLASVFWLSGIVFLCVMFTEECRDATRRITAFGLVISLMTAALFFASVTAKLTGAL